MAVACCRCVRFSFFVLLAGMLIVGSSAPRSAWGEPAGESPFPRRVKAPALDGGVDWINTAGPIDLAQLRGKFVLLDFWTYCCINCMHILPELKKLEHAYPNEIVVIGVHSAKFATEQDTKNIQDAVLRYEIEHPVVNDARHKIWDRFEVESWPTLRVIDPEGYVVAGNSGEIDFESLDKFFKRAIPYYREKGLLDTTPLRFELASYKAAATPLRFPGKLLADEKSDRLYIADSNHNRIVVARLDGTLVDTIGSGEAGATNGAYAAASFDHPQGMALDAGRLYVADTENHLLRTVDLAKKQVETIAGTGHQSHGTRAGGGRSKRRSTAPGRCRSRATICMSPWQGFTRSGKCRWTSRRKSVRLPGMVARTSSMAGICRRSRSSRVFARLRSPAG